MENQNQNNGWSSGAYFAIYWALFVGAFIAVIFFAVGRIGLR